MLAAMVEKSKPGWVLLLAAALAAVAGAAVMGARSFSAPDLRPETVPAPVTGTPHPVVVNPGHAAPRVTTDLFTPHGSAVDMACATCHAVKTPNPATTSAAQLKDFHPGMTYAHGSLSCLSCHNAGNYDTLRLANGQAVPFERAVELCAQCHGPQSRDYRNGSHGGMNGFWDLQSGPRRRNTCVDCHVPHAPAYPRVQPVFPPRDGLPPAGHQPAAIPHGSH